MGDALLPSYSIHHCSGALLHYHGQALLVQNHKWDGWIVPGGHIEPGESPLDALVRELDEELPGLRMTPGSIRFWGIKTKPPSEDYRDSNAMFLFYDFAARIADLGFTHSPELRGYALFSAEQTRGLRMPDGAEQMVRRAIADGVVR
ncbi:hypothetical protein COY28_06060 [Candidatus Woesearchaeota archaeon CG_4_10_14_0_2_um_filter_57_5]|nr:MAG: hypothetical protein COY28_06060 [Candidatus Woesearchaeota archaeon CG_4_10_14_0_2_um_filter_57_5]